MASRSQMTRRGFLGSLVALFALGRDAVASGLTQAKVQLGLYNTGAVGTLNAALSDDYWANADKTAYKNQLFDEIRLKPIEGGYMPMITGEGQQDFDPEVVADVVFKKMFRLPKYMDGAKAVEYLNSGYDNSVGAPYVDSFFLLDFTLFYTSYTQRMYKREDAANSRTILFYEKVNPAMVTQAEWDRYEIVAQGIIDKKATGWFFNSVVPASDIYGMFIVTPGTTYKSRVTYITKVVFGADAGWVANMGSKMPMVLKSGLKSGFKAAVRICQAEQAKRGAGG